MGRTDVPCGISLIERDKDRSAFTNAGSSNFEGKRPTRQCAIPDGSRAISLSAGNGRSEVGSRLPNGPPDWPL
jgi:hypothetical protein